MSLHTTPESEFESWPPLHDGPIHAAPITPEDIVHPDYLEINVQFNKRLRDFYGLSASGVFEAVVATRRTRVQGVVHLATSQEQYGNGNWEDITEGRIIAAKHRAQPIIERALSGHTSVKPLDQYGIPQDPQVKKVYEQLGNKNDPLFQILELVRANRSSISDRDTGVLVIDSLALFKMNMLKAAANEQNQQSA